MRKLITLLAVLGFATTAFADDHMNQNGSFRVQYNNTNNYDFSDATGDRSQAVSQRLIWSPSFKVSDALSVHTTLVHSAYWGANADQIPGDQGATVATGINNPERGNDTLVVNEAYFNWMINDESMLRVGRGSFTAADGRVIAQNEWEQVRKAFEGAMYSHDAEMARASLFAVRGGNGQTNANSYGNFFGANIDFKSLPEFLKMANLHYVIVKRDADTYWVNGATPTLADEDSSRLGVTLGGDTMGIDYNFTYAMYSGEFGGAQDISASMMDLTVGYSMPDMMNSRFHVQYHTDSGDDDGTGTGDFEQYTGFHYDVHNNAGLMDILGYGNLTFLKVGATFDPQEDVSVGLDYYMFTATEDSAAAGNVRADGTTAIAGAAGEDDLGTEIDVWVKKAYSSNFSTMLRYGTFAAGDRVGTGLDDAEQVYLEAEMTF